MSQPAFEYSKTYTLLRSAVVPFRSPVQTKPAVWANQCGSYSYSWFDCLSLTHLLAHFFSYFFFCTNLFCVFYWRWILDVAKRCERHLKKKNKRILSYYCFVLLWMANNLRQQFYCIHGRFVYFLAIHFEFAPLRLLWLLNTSSRHAFCSDTDNNKTCSLSAYEYVNNPSGESIWWYCLPCCW